MRPATAALHAAVRGSYDLAIRVEVLRAGVVQVLPDGSTAIAAVTAGAVTLDSTAATRGSLDLSLVDDGTLGLVPQTPADLLAPYGNELRVSRGVVYPGGGVEVVAIGVYRINDCVVTDGPDGQTIEITGQDRSAQIIDARFEDAFQVAQGTNVETAILATIQPVMPTVQTIFPGATFATPLLNAAEGDDRWAFAQSIASACGLILYFDADGRLRLAPPPVGAPVATFAEGVAGVLLTASRDWTRTGAYNRVIATGENTGETAPARGIATDTDPSSPTRYGGPFGRVPAFYSSEFITTNDQAAAAAQTVLAQQLGTTQAVTFGVLADPTLEPDDVVQITRLRTGINETHIVSQLVIPLTADAPMTGATRAVLTT